MGEKHLQWYMSAEQFQNDQRNKGRNKYNAKRTWSDLCQMEFDSKAQAIRAEELHLLERAHVISDLEYNVKFKLCLNPKITVTIDFSYTENGEVIFEDTKGVLTRDSRTKYAWLKEKYNLVVKLTGK